LNRLVLALLLIGIVGLDLIHYFVVLWVIKEALDVRLISDVPDRALLLILDQDHRFTFSIQILPVVTFVVENFK